MKRISPIIALVFLSVSSLAQALFVPGGVSGIGVSANDYIGVGTDAPTSHLDVKGTITIRENPSTMANGDVALYNSPGTDYGFLIRPYDASFSGGTFNWLLDFGYREDKKVWYAEGGFHVYGGSVGIGTENPDATLTVNDDVHAEEVRVDLNIPAPDYVFESDYKMPSLRELQAYIKRNKHLPEVPSAKEMEQDGINLSEMNMILLKKVEELTLYLIEANEKIETLPDEVKGLKESRKQ